MKRRVAWFLLFATLPAATFVLATIWQFSDEYQAAANRGGVIPFLAAFGALTSIYALVLGLLLALAGRREKELAKEANVYLAAGQQAASGDTSTALANLTRSLELFDRLLGNHPADKDYLQQRQLVLDSLRELRSQ